jgi:hypothetical protein
MKSNHLVIKLGVTVFAVGVGALVFACSSSSTTNPAPPGDDASSPEDGGASSSGGSSSGGSSGGASSSGGSSSSGSSSGATNDASTDAAPDTGTAPCVNDGGASATCLSCATVATDPYNTCSQYFTVGCIPFDNSVVPAHPSL